MHIDTKREALAAGDKLVEKLKASPKFGKLGWRAQIYQVSGGWNVSAISRDKSWEVECYDYHNPKRPTYCVYIGRRKGLDSWWVDSAKTLEGALRTVYKAAKSSTVESAACIGMKLVPIKKKAS